MLFLSTIDVEDEKLTGGAKKPSKSKNTKELNALLSELTEVESLGVMKINNTGALRKIKTNANTGVEKNINQCSKIKIKTELSHVEDYFDFSFRPDVKCEVCSKPEVVEPVQALSEEKKIVKAEKVEKPAAKKTAVKQKTSSAANKQKVIAELKTVTNEIIKETRSRVNLDEQASHNVWIARMSAMFDCDARMIKS